MKLAHFLLPLGVLLFLLSIHLTPLTRSSSAQSLVDPPEISTGMDQQFRVSVGPPDASLAVWVLQPPAGTPIKGTVL
ncbi:MAG TPA: hypothetical protein VGN88_01405, partial [Phycisphaerae bacterium]